jgi:hypothetical protein
LREFVPSAWQPEDSQSSGWSDCDGRKCAPYDPERFELLRCNMEYALSNASTISAPKPAYPVLRRALYHAEAPALASSHFPCVRQPRWGYCDNLNFDATSAAHPVTNISRVIAGNNDIGWDAALNDVAYCPATGLIGTAAQAAALPKVPNRPAKNKVKRRKFKARQQQRAQNGEAFKPQPESVRDIVDSLTSCLTYALADIVLLPHGTPYSHHCLANCLSQTPIPRIANHPSACVCLSTKSVVLGAFNILQCSPLQAYVPAGELCSASYRVTHLGPQVALTDNRGPVTISAVNKSISIFQWLSKTGLLT